MFKISSRWSILQKASLSMMTTTTSTSTTMSTTQKMDESFMRLAFRHAQHAFREKEVPIGAILVDDEGEVIAAARNRVEESHDATAHAEIECLRMAAKYKKNWRLNNTTLYTTLEPCPTCMSAIQSFRVKRVVYGAKDLRLGACGSYVNLNEKKHPFHQVEVTGDVLGEDCSILLKRFFQSIRNEKFRFGSYDLGRGQETNIVHEAVSSSPKITDDQSEHVVHAAV